MYTWIIKNSRSRDQYIFARTISIDFFISECQTFHFDRQHIRCFISNDQNDLHLIITIQFSLSIFSDSSSDSVCIFLVFWTSVFIEKCYVVFRRRARSYSLNQFSCIDLNSSHHSMIQFSMIMLHQMTSFYLNLRFDFIINHHHFYRRFVSISEYMKSRFDHALQSSSDALLCESGQLRDAHRLLHWNDAVFCESRMTIIKSRERTNTSSFRRRSNKFRSRSVKCHDKLIIELDIIRREIDRAAIIRMCKYRSTCI
jgi:hypothetical protein